MNHKNTIDPVKVSMDSINRIGLTGAASPVFNYNIIQGIKLIHVCMSLENIIYELDMLTSYQPTSIDL